MASKTTVDAVKARMAESWTACPFFGPNERSERPADASSFIDVEFPFAVTEQISMGSPGSNVYREEGVFRLIIAAQRGSGSDEGLTWADQLGDLFRAKEFGGIRTFSPNPPVIDERNDNGGYFLLGIAVPYQRDFLA